MENKTVDRRNFLKLGAGLSAGAVAMGGFLPKALAATCGLTPPQTEGPFYPGEANFTADNDLTWVPGSPRRALGQVIYVDGVVTVQNCRPIEGANVEIWQACETCSYNSPKDENPAPRDPYFKYWGETYTDANGRYSFKSILPGAYPNDDTWTRPAHIHFKIAKRGFHGLTTQMYFAGDPYLEKDLILLNLSPEERARVIVEFGAAGPGRQAGAREGTFDISIRPVRG